MASTTMNAQGNKQNKFSRRIAVPLRVLNRFYMNTMFGCAAGFDHSSAVANYAGMAPEVSASLPKNFSTNSPASSRESINLKEQELRELICAVSGKLNGSASKVDMKRAIELRKPTSVVAPTPEMRSYSVRLGRIDEIHPCDFTKLGDANLRVHTRCRSYAVTRRRTHVF